MSSILNVFNSLQTEFEKVNQDLQSVEDNLKKLTGGQSSSLKRSLKRSLPESESSNGVPDANPNESYKRNKFVGRAFSRIHNTNRQREVTVESDDKEDQIHKPVLLSQVVPAIKEVKSRNEILEERLPDEKSKARNRRMFGVILGTLQKFQSEESRRKQTTQKRVEIEEKLELQAEKERDVIKKEKKELFKKKRESQAQLRRIELKMERVQVHQEWEKSHKTLVNFIQTKTKPSLFYLPKEHTEESEKRWKQTKDKYRLILAEKRAKVQKELSDIDEMYKKESELEIDEENKDDDEKMSECNDKHREVSLNESVDDTIEPSEDSTFQQAEPGNHENEVNNNADSLIESEPINTEKSSSEHLAEKEFEPIYDDDE